MQIRAFNFYHLSCVLEHTAWNSVTPHASRPALIVEITTEDGLSGWGSASGAGRNGDDRLAAATELLPGKDLRRWSMLTNALRLSNGGGLNVVAAIETALLDAFGQSLGVSVASLLGSQRNHVPAYASGGYYYDHIPDRREMLQNEVSTAQNRGFRYYKMKIGRAPRDQDIADIRAVKDAAGDTIQVAVDPNCAYSYPEALLMGRELDDLGILWYEEPVDKHNLDAYRELRKRLSTPVSGGEGYSELQEFRQAIAAQAIDIVQPDLIGAGGFRSSMNIAALAGAYGIACLPHCWADSLHMVATAQLLATLPTSLGIEFGMPPLLEYDVTENPIRRELLGMEPPLDPNGNVTVSDSPGLGVDINRETLEKFSIE